MPLSAHRRCLLTLGVAVSLCLGGSPVFAQSDLESRVDRIEQRLEGSALMGLMNEAETLRGEVTTLRGEIEILERQLRDLRDQQRQLYLDLDERLRMLELGDSALAPEAPAPDTSDGTLSEPSLNGVDDGPVTDERDTAADARSDYDQAFALLREGDFDAAGAAFEAFLDAHDGSELAANARYWLGESHYVVREFDNAIQEFQRVLDDHPDSNKVPDALLKIGFSYLEQGDRDAARDRLEAVVEAYPDSTAANLAEQRLDQF
ncbi:tol-pal system protein YbgF [Spiribacter sp. 2438]|uniref:tol-pal system protein YbgF n=1 Tax=Spiribacter sp. 2438 TaxID=2666185 RepID=UPI0018A1C4C7|nr:tol-pal system protein YbgF [Spiribacter sp. 2438]